MFSQSQLAQAHGLQLSGPLRTSCRPAPTPSHHPDALQRGTVVAHARRKWYAVFEPASARGVYTVWDQVKELVTGYSNNMHKGFATETAALQWLNSLAMKAMQQDAALQPLRQQALAAAAEAPSVVAASALTARSLPSASASETRSAAASPLPSLLPSPASPDESTDTSPPAATELRPWQTDTVVLDVPAAPSREYYTKWYAVRFVAGGQPGVYSCWKEAEAAIGGRYSEFRSFRSHAEALAYAFGPELAQQLAAQQQQGLQGQQGQGQEQQGQGQQAQQVLEAVQGQQQWAEGAAAAPGEAWQQQQAAPHYHHHGHNPGQAYAHNAHDGQQQQAPLQQEHQLQQQDYQQWTQEGAAEQAPPQEPRFQFQEPDFVRQLRLEFGDALIEELHWPGERARSSSGGGSSAKPFRHRWAGGGAPLRAALAACDADAPRRLPVTPGDEGTAPSLAVSRQSNDGGSGGSGGSTARTWPLPTPAALDAPLGYGGAAHRQPVPTAAAVAVSEQRRAGAELVTQERSGPLYMAAPWVQAQREERRDAEPGPSARTSAPSTGEPELPVHQLRRGRGRPRKTELTVASARQESEQQQQLSSGGDMTAPPRRRVGRPRKADAAVAQEQPRQQVQQDGNGDTTEPLKRKVGRPRKADAAPASAVQVRVRQQERQEQEQPLQVAQQPEAPAAKRRVGRPRKSAAVPVAASPVGVAAAVGEPPAPMAAPLPPVDGRDAALRLAGDAGLAAAVSSLAAVAARELSLVGLEGLWQTAEQERSRLTGQPSTTCVGAPRAGSASSGSGSSGSSSSHRSPAPGGFVAAGLLLKVLYTRTGCSSGGTTVGAAAAPGACSSATLAASQLQNHHAGRRALVLDLLLRELRPLLDAKREREQHLPLGAAQASERADRRRSEERSSHECRAERERERPPSASPQGQASEAPSHGEAIARAAKGRPATRVRVGASRRATPLQVRDRPGDTGTGADDAAAPAAVRRQRRGGAAAGTTAAAAADAAASGLDGGEGARVSSSGESGRSAQEPDVERVRSGEHDRQQLEERYRRQRDADLQWAVADQASAVLQPDWQPGPGAAVSGVEA